MEALGAVFKVVFEYDIRAVIEKVWEFVEKDHCASISARSVFQESVWMDDSSNTNAYVTRLVPTLNPKQCEGQARELAEAIS